jgi:hypothetical protein
VRFEVNVGAPCVGNEAPAGSVAESVALDANPCQDVTLAIVFAANPTDAHRSAPPRHACRLTGYVRSPVDVRPVGLKANGSRAECRELIV